MPKRLNKQQREKLAAAQEQGYDVDEALKLSNQLCFPLYACSKELVRRYKPFLDELDLTYTQYLVMLVLWEQGSASVKELGAQLMLDSGTLTPLLKKLEERGLVSRVRSSTDERQLIVSLTKEGTALKDCASVVPLQIGSCIGLEPDEVIELLRLLRKVTAGIENSWESA